jgi:hypothetical protein
MGGKANSIDDHRQTMNSVVVDERHRSGRLSGEGHVRERDHLHRQPEQIRQSENSSKQLIATEQNSSSRKPTTNHRLDKVRSHIPIQQQLHHPREHRLRQENGCPELIDNFPRSTKVGDMNGSDNSKSVISPTGTLKPPLKPRRLRHNKSVSTKSTSSATYFSSDSSEGGDGDDDSIEAPDIHIRVYDSKGNSSKSSNWSSTSSLAPYDSTDDSSRLAVIPFQEKKVKKQRSRPSTKISSQIVPANSDDDDVDPFRHLGSLAFPGEEEFANAYNLSSSDDTDSASNDGIVDLDEIIAETSARWKTTVTAIVSNTVTSTSAAKGALEVANANIYSGTPSNGNKKFASHIGTLSTNEMSLVRPVATCTRISADTAVPAKDNTMIEKQQAEIESLRAALKAQRHRQHHKHQQPQSKFSSEMIVLPETCEFDSPNSNIQFPAFSSQNTEGDITIDCVPVEHIEVNHDAADPNSSHYWQDDLTVWSGFNTVTGGIDGSVAQSNQKLDAGVNVKGSRGKPLQKKRPDAESATGASALNGVPVRVVEDMKVDLSSGMSGTVRKAVYSGTINAHTRLPEGQGTFDFLETGDKYQGEVHSGEMHGAGTYIFGRSSRKNSKGKSSSRPKELKGTFEHNVFIG